jgi:hypothetical protein
MLAKFGEFKAKGTLSLEDLWLLVEHLRDIQKSKIEFEGMRTRAKVERCIKIRYCYIGS